MVLPRLIGPANPDCFIPIKYCFTQMDPIGGANSMSEKIRYLIQIALLSASALYLTASLASGYLDTAFSFPGEQSAPATFLLRRFVMGSGGLTSSNETFLLHSTSGEGWISTSSGLNYRMQAGYWNSLSTAEAVSVPISEIEENPLIFRLYQNYPNPFNPQTTFMYDLGKETLVCAEIVNSVGQTVRHFNAEMRQAGHYQMVWDAKDDAGHPMGSGVYLFILRAEETRSADGGPVKVIEKSIKILLIK